MLLEFFYSLTSCLGRQTKNQWLDVSQVRHHLTPLGFLICKTWPCIQVKINVWILKLKTTNVRWRSICVILQKEKRQALIYLLRLCKRENLRFFIFLACFYGLLMSFVQCFLNKEKLVGVHQKSSCRTNVLLIFLRSIVHCGQNMSCYMSTN